jgi:hypothetical protein
VGRSGGFAGRPGFNGGFNGGHGFNHFNNGFNHRFNSLAVTSFRVIVSDY